MQEFIVRPNAENIGSNLRHRLSAYGAQMDQIRSRVEQPKLRLLDLVKALVRTKRHDPGNRQ
jgi:hypothetical protein